MPRSHLLVFALVSISLVAFGALADRALDGQGRRAQEAAARESQETARLTALSVRAALAQLEQHVVAGESDATVTVERLANPPRAAIGAASGVPYGRRSRAELATLLTSTRASPSGLPEAVLARLALGEAASVSAAGQAPPPDVAGQLLSGRLPVRPEDLPGLAQALGVGGDGRVRQLQDRLRAAPDGAGLPEAPAFARVRRGGSAVGWTRTHDERVKYEIPIATLLERARVADRASILPEGAPALDGARHARADVPDVLGLSLWIEVRTPGALRLRLLRIALWIAVIASLACLVAVQRALNAEAQATAREKAFLTSVTHELRTPLAAIRLFGETLAEGRGDAREYGTLVAEESQRLEGLVERVLAVTRAGERPHFAPTQPGDLLRSAIELILPRAERRSVSLTCQADDALPTTSWDGEAVRRALLNLLDNAVKHGREGGHVLARAESDGSFVRLSVADDGPGIGRRERKVLFQRFVRGATDAPGTGLGLHLVEQVARAHGGSVDLVSEDGRGCVFTLRLPSHPPAALLAAVPEP